MPRSDLPPHVFPRLSGRRTGNRNAVFHEAAAVVESRATDRANGRAERDSNGGVDRSFRREANCAERIKGELMTVVVGETPAVGHDRSVGPTPSRERIVFFSPSARRLSSRAA